MGARQSVAAAQNEKERLQRALSLLSGAPLLQACPAGVIRVAAEELMTERDAHFGEDALKAWGPGLSVIHTGQLRLLWHDTELCTLGPGDAVGEETLLGGKPALEFDRAEVSTARLEAWVLPQSSREQAEDAGLLSYLEAARCEAQRQLLQRARAAADWDVERHRVLVDIGCSPHKRGKMNHPQLWAGAEGSCSPKP